MNLRESGTLLAVGLENLAWNLVLKVREARELGRHPWWWRLQSLLVREYLLSPPHRLVAWESGSPGAEAGDLVYGETPLLTARHMLHRAGLAPPDVFVDLGSGRGLAVLAAHLFFGVPAVGVEILESFVERSRRIARALGLSGVEFVQGDARNADLSRGAVFLVAGTTFSDSLRRDLARRLEERLRSGSCSKASRADSRPIRLVSLSAPLDCPGLPVAGQERLRFSWGQGTVYYQASSGQELPGGP